MMRCCGFLRRHRVEPVDQVLPLDLILGGGRHPEELAPQPAGALVECQGNDFDMLLKA